MKIRTAVTLVVLTLLNRYSIVMIELVLALYREIWHQSHIKPVSAEC